MLFQQKMPPWAQEQASAGTHTNQFTKKSSSSYETNTVGHTTTTVKTTTYRQEVQVILDLYPWNPNDEKFSRETFVLN